MITRLLERILLRLIVRPRISQAIRRALLNQPAIFGDENRVKIAANAIVHNALFNVQSGHILVAEDVFFGHNVSLLTGTHDYSKFGAARKEAIPTDMHDIVVGKGAWLASNVTVIGPAKIGEHAVVAAGAVVTGDVEPFAIVAGVPACKIGSLDSGTAPAKAP